MSAPTQTTIKQFQTIGDTPDNWQQTLDFGQFDPSLGTLTAVDVGLTADAIGNVSVVDLGPVPAIVTAALTSDVSAQSPGGYALGTAYADAYGSGTVAANSGTVAVALAGTGSYDSGLLSGIDLGDFTGTGAVPLTVTNAASLHVTGPANMWVAAGASTGAVASLQYAYIPPSQPSLNGSETTGVISVAVNYDYNPISPSYGSVTTAEQTFQFNDATVGWNTNIAVQGFNPALGTLEAVNISLSGDIAARASMANDSAGTSDISTTQTAIVALGSLLSVAPDVNASLQLDKGASSARTGLSATAAGTKQLVDANDLAAFAGQRTITIPIDTTGTATVDGPANMSAMLFAQAGATVTVSYTYLPPDPPASPLVWEDATSGRWTDTGAWGREDQPSGLRDANPPQPTDDVAITMAGSYTITLDAAQTIHSLVIDAPGATVVLDANLNISGDFILDAGTIEFNGATLSAGDITMAGGSMVGETIDLNSAGASAINGGSLVSQGMVILEAGSVPDFQTQIVSATSIVVDGTSFPGTIAVAECFARGTRIATPFGEVSVETLAVGDTVLLASGDTAPITWIGYREIDCRRHPVPRDVWPVCIRSGAFGDAGPCRDLLLSPDHAVFVDGVLIPVKHLINGDSIRQVRRASIAYFHVELPRHDILLAEGLTVESYLDTGSRGNFANAGTPITLHPNFSTLAWEAGGCAPLVVTGLQLEAVRQRIAAITRAAGRPAKGRGRRRVA